MSHLAVPVDQAAARARAQAELAELYLGHRGQPQRPHRRHKARRRRTVVIAQLAIATGLVLLLSAGGWLVWTRHTGNERATHTIEALQQQWTAEPPADDPVVQKADPVAHTESLPIPGKAFAIITVPRFGKDWQMPIFEGTGTNVLRGGVGHYPKTALPGELGNFAVAGHRTTWARPFQDIDQLRAGDKVIVQTRQARYTYRVTGHQIVQPDETAVLDAVPGNPDAMPDRAQLTLTTCHPEYSALQRWVVRAVLVGNQPA